MPSLIENPPTPAVPSQLQPLAVELPLQGTEQTAEPVVVAENMPESSEREVAEREHVVLDAFGKPSGFVESAGPDQSVVESALSS